MLYVPIRTDAAPALSAAIYQLTRPQQVRNANDVSTYYCAWFVNPTRPDVATLEIPNAEDIPIHVAADSATLQQLLSVFVPAELSQAEVDGLVAAVTAFAGSRVEVADLIPTSWQPFVMTRQQALAAGWLTEVQP